MHADTRRRLLALLYVSLGVALVAAVLMATHAGAAETNDPDPEPCVKAHATTSGAGGWAAGPQDRDPDCDGGGGGGGGGGTGGGDDEDEPTYAPQVSGSQSCWGSTVSIQSRARGNVGHSVYGQTQGTWSNGSTFLINTSHTSFESGQWLVWSDWDHPDDDGGVHVEETAAFCY